MNFIYIFQENPSKKKRKKNTMQTQEKQNPQYREVRKERVNGKGRKYPGGET